VYKARSLLWARQVMGGYSALDCLLTCCPSNAPQLHSFTFHIISSSSGRSEQNIQLEAKPQFADEVEAIGRECIEHARR